MARTRPRTGIGPKTQFIQISVSHLLKILILLNFILLLFQTRARHLVSLKEKKQVYNFLNNTFEGWVGVGGGIRHVCS